MSIDLLTKPGNPASTLRTHLTELQAIRDPETLAEHMLELVAPHNSNGGLSAVNWKRFQFEVRGCLGRRDPLVQLQFYLHNYLLAAAGLKTIKA